MNRRNSEERSGGGNGSPPNNSGVGGRPVSPRSRVGKRSPTPKEKYDNSSKINNNPSSSGSASLRNEKLKNGLNSSIQQHHHHQEPAELPVINDQLGPEAASLGIIDHDDHVNNTAKTSKGGKEKVNSGDGGCSGGGVNVWPRIYIPLTRKEKEEDFLAMKGTKLPHRPKKRPKAIDRLLQVFLFPDLILIISFLDFLDNIIIVSVKFEWF